MKQGFLAGKKTYTLAIVAVITALAGYATGELTLTQAAAAAWVGGVAAALRHAVQQVEKRWNASD